MDSKHCTTIFKHFLTKCIANSVILFSASVPAFIRFLQDENTNFFTTLNFNKYLIFRILEASSFSIEKEILPENLIDILKKW